MSANSRPLLYALAAFSTALAAPAALAQDLLIGQVSSLTSAQNASNGKALYAGINAYFDYVNASGGIGGRKVRLVNKDDEYASAKMIDLTKQFIADRDILALSGYQNTSGLAELSKQNIPGTAGIAMIAPFQGDRSIVGAKNFFPFRSGYPDEIAALVKEAKFTDKKRVVVIYQSMTFGPPMAKLARELAKDQGLNIVDATMIDGARPDIEAAVAGPVASASKHSPDAVFVLAGSKYMLEVVKQLKNSPTLDGTQIYLLSLAPAQDVVKAVGEAKARGIVISQVVPFPFSATLPLVGEYQKLMKQYAPNEPFSFSSLEGFVIGKITVEALKRAGPKPTREKVVKALNNLGEFNLGGVYVNYTSKERNGWRGVDLTVIGPGGKLLR